MSKPDSTLKTQAEVLADNARLTAELSTAKASADKATAELATANASLATVTAERDQLANDLTTTKASLASVTNERDEAKAKVEKLESEKASVDKAAAAKLAELGISPKALPTASASGTAQKLSPLAAIKAVQSGAMTPAAAAAAAFPSK
jgi:chromosome segregation ATPase